MKTFDAIYAVVASIPKGKVLTYGKVAKLTNVKNPRVVGFALHANKDPWRIPCHRVVRRDGSLTKGYAFGGYKKQKERLGEEGITFIKNTIVNLQKHLATQ